MNYDLRRENPEGRRKFVRYANSLLKKERSNVCLIDESNRTLNQNSYIHVLCRIMAIEVGVTEDYAKQVYFKELANKELFTSITKDPVTGQMQVFKKSTADLSVPEMRQAIENFRNWAADNGYYLPEANISNDGSMSFASDKDKEAFHQAQILTSNH